MIRRLIILLLIVGCAPTKPTTANFYLGMTEDEFLKQNNINIDTETIIGLDDDEKYYTLNTNSIRQ